MQASIGKYGPEMEKFFYGMMQGGGAQNLQSILGNMRNQISTSQSDVMNQLKASGIPLQSSAMTGAATRALGDVNRQGYTDMGRLELDEMNKVMGRQFQGASGVGNMPAYFGQPGSLELQAISALTPHHQMNVQRDAMRSDFMNKLLMQNFYQPERVMGQSPFQQYLAPFINMAMQAFGGSIPGMIGSGARMLTGAKTGGT